MQRKSLLIGSLFLTAAFIAPAAMQANATPQVSVRFYDRDHKDYHNWDDNETRYYTQYRVDHPKLSVNFGRTNRSQQRAYWSWRHDHHD